ncbi:unnamed protein product [Vitrella brassicaformis CCMP3155]|uniref:GH26 domain-containing protein n=2 Tax=Vitrella brassicaformis TaxID=1169539 RepID=A0A0G4F7P7_VITBC|nr:unnamed protein product [Vitrella brassicaformis CCMP3155]|eukprot:CEM08516.1 unnamed protein product [Vitrella brassicaformis CCMP3155]
MGRIGPPHGGTLPSRSRNGIILGAILPANESLASFNAHTRIEHAAFLRFVPFPNIVVNWTERAKAHLFLEECRENGAMAALTLETMGGLNNYTAKHVEYLADFLNKWNDTVPIFIRYNHEMNGSWYPWGQQPDLYIAKFNEFARIMKNRTSHVAMVWTPNLEWGFPWPEGPYYNASIDQDGDIVDDAFWQFLPDQDLVDWVGMSVYYWGCEEPDGVCAPGYNTLPKTRMFRDAVLTFYANVTQRLNKPMMISETAALFNTDRLGASEAAIKTAWMRQVYGWSQDHHLIRAIFWFNQHKFEKEINGEVDWRLDGNDDVVLSYRQIVGDDQQFIKSSIRSPMAAELGVTHRLRTVSSDRREGPD